jgi:hypothetical protein
VRKIHGGANYASKYGNLVVNVCFIVLHCEALFFFVFVLEVMWEFKWDEKSADIHGPHTTSQMQSWVDQGYFKNPVLVRKSGTDGQFYNSSRVDFELYL